MRFKLPMPPAEGGVNSNGMPAHQIEQTEG
jgi:hypothetical protein